MPRPEVDQLVWQAFIELSDFSIGCKTFCNWLYASDPTDQAGSGVEELKKLLTPTRQDLAKEETARKAKIEELEKRVKELEAKLPQEQPSSDIKDKHSAVRTCADAAVLCKNNLPQDSHNSCKAQGLLSNIQDDTELYPLALSVLKERQDLAMSDTGTTTPSESDDGPPGLSRNGTVTQEDKEPDYGSAWQEAGGHKPSQKNSAWVKKEEDALAIKSCPFQTFVRDLPELYLKAKRAQKPFAEEVERLAKKTNGVVMGPPQPSPLSKKLSSQLSKSESCTEFASDDFFAGLKGWDRAKAKATVKYLDADDKVAWYRLTDISRSTIIYNNWDEVYNAAKKIFEEKRDDIVHFNDRIPAGGKRRYADFLFLIRHEGFIHELQLNAQSMINIKEGKGHKEYETQRYLDESCLDAASRDDYQGVAHFIQKGANLNAMDSDGRTPLLRAAKCGYITTMRLLLALQADVKVRDNNGNTALHLCAKGGFVQACWLLITESEACTGSLNYDGQTAVDIVKSDDAKSLLLHYDNLHGVKLNDAIQQQNVEAVGSLLKEGASVAAAQGWNRKEPVWAFAAKAENTEIAVLLVQSVLDTKASPIFQSAEAGSLLVQAARVSLEAGNRKAADLLAFTLRDAHFPRISQLIAECPDYTHLLKLASACRPQEDCMRAATAILNCARKERSATQLDNALVVLEQLAELCDNFGGEQDRILAKKLMEENDVVLSAALLLRDCQEARTTEEKDPQEEKQAILKEISRAATKLFQRAMVGNPSLRNTLRENRVHLYVVRTMQKYPKDLKINQQGTRCLSQLTTGSADALRSVGGLDCIVEAMSTYKDDYTINNFGTGVLRSISEWEGREAVAGHQHALKVTLQAMSKWNNGKDGLRIQQHCLRILHDICLTTCRHKCRQVEEYDVTKLVERAFWRFPELEEGGTQILNLLAQPRLMILVNLMDTVMDMSSLSAHANRRQSEKSHSHQHHLALSLSQVISIYKKDEQKFVQEFLALEPVLKAVHVLQELRATHDVFLVVPPKVDGICIASAAMQWVRARLGRDWLQRMIITEREDLIQADWYIGVPRRVASPPPDSSARELRPQSGALKLSPVWKLLAFSHSERPSDENVAGWSNLLSKMEALAKGHKRRIHEPPAKRFVLIDQDNTFTNFNESVVQIASEELHLPKPTTMCTRVAQGYESQHRKDVEAIYGRENFIANLEQLPNSQAAMNRMSKIYECFIVTAPPKTPYAASEKIGWVEKHLGPEWVSRMIITDQKTLLFGDALIDDAPDPLGVKSFKPYWVHFPFKQDWNENLAKDGRRVDWSDAEKRLEVFFRDEYVARKEIPDQPAPGA